MRMPAVLGALPNKSKDRKSAALPYDLAEMDRAETALEMVRDGSPGALTELGVRLGEPPPTQVVRAKDIIELFDTTPDLSGTPMLTSRGSSATPTSATFHIFWQAFETPVNRRPHGERNSAPHRSVSCKTS